MKTRFLKTNKLLIALTMILSFGSTTFSQIAVPDSFLLNLKSCDATIQDMLPLVLLPANIDMSNLVALAPASKPKGINNYYYWDMGDGTKDTGTLVLHNYAKSGKYLVTLQSIVVTNTKMGLRQQICSNSQWVTAGISEPVKTCDASFQPMILATTDFPSSYSEVVGYNALNTFYDSYKWNFGDGTTDTGRSVKHHFEIEGKYLVSLTVKDDNCEDTKTMWMTKRGVYIPFDSTANCSTNIYMDFNGQSVLFYDDNGIRYFKAPEPNGFSETLIWDFGDGSKDTGNYITHVYAKPGRYLATLTKSSYYDPCFKSPITCYAQPFLQCINTEQFEVVIGEPNSNCKAELSYTITGQTLVIRDNIVYAHTMRNINTITERRHWEFGNGSDTVSNNFVTHTYASDGKYRVRLIKSILNDPCPFIHDTLPRCMAMPFLICMDTTYLDIEIRKPCKANFETSIVDSNVTVLVNPFYYVKKVLPILENDPVETIVAAPNLYNKLDFGDGTFKESTGYNITTTHTYAKKGDYTICLYVATVPDSVLPYVKLAYYCNDTFCKTITISDSVSKPIVASIYPNPASNYMTVSVKNNFNKMDLRLYDQTGKLKKEVFEIQSDVKEINTEGLENGLYFYTLSDGGNVVLKGKIAVSK